MARAVLCAVVNFVNFAILISAHYQREVPYPRFEFMESALPNNSYIDRAQMREGNDSLMCVTTYSACCRNPPMGNWFDHHGEPVHQGLDNADTLYITRGDGVVRLHRITGGASGLWRCDIPDESGNLQSIYIFMGFWETGQITDVRLEFSGLHTPSHVSPVFTLKCTNHGPATTVIWTESGDTEWIRENATFRMTKTILNTLYPATYENSLTVSVRRDGTYRCTVRSNRPTENRGTSNELRVVEATPPSHVSVLAWTSSSVKVSWQAPPQTAIITGYHVLYRGEGEASWSREEVEAGVTSKIITGLSEGNQTYHVSVVSLSQHLPSDPQQAMVSYGRTYFEIYFGKDPLVFSLNWSHQDASTMEHDLLHYLKANIASRKLPPQMIKRGAFYFGPGVSYRGFIGGEESFVKEIAPHIEAIVRQRRFIPEGLLNLRVYSECPVLISSLDAEQCLQE